MNEKLAINLDLVKTSEISFYLSFLSWKVFDT